MIYVSLLTINNKDYAMKLRKEITITTNAKPPFTAQVQFSMIHHCQ